MKLDVAVIEQKLLETGGLWEWVDILDAIERREMQMLAVGESFVVVNVLDFPRKRLVNIVLVYGTLRDMAALEEVVETFRAATGANAVFAAGRRGWRSQEHGNWREISVNFIKE